MVYELIIAASENGGDGNVKIGCRKFSEVSDSVPKEGRHGNFTV
jgi:hypothetical protein